MISAQSNKRLIKPGQSAFYVDKNSALVHCFVKEVKKEEIFVTSLSGVPHGWFSHDTLFHKAHEAYLNRIIK